MKQPKPENVSTEEWHAIQKSITIITEYFPNIALFVNWVDDDNETKHLHVFQGNGFALQNHINKWSDGYFDEMTEEDDD